MLKNTILWSVVFADWFVGLKDIPNSNQTLVGKTVVTRVYMELVLSSILVMDFCDRID